MQPQAKYNGCTQDDQFYLDFAIEEAQDLVAESLAYLRDHPSGGTPRYKTWFGEFTKERYAKVRATYEALDARSFEDGEYTCTCNEPDAWAFTSPDTPGVITLCPGFWGADPFGTDSQAGVLIHEATQWTVVAGTQEYAWGHMYCKALAEERPDRAVNNGESYEYFSENTPWLS